MVVPMTLIDAYNGIYGIIVEPLTTTPSPLGHHCIHNIYVYNIMAKGLTKTTVALLKGLNENELYIVSD